MEVKILGTGGFENKGMPVNSFLVDGHLLAETPPDILQSLRRERVNLDDIDTVVITHFHGDHCFGLPFLLFDRYMAGEKRKGAAVPTDRAAPTGRAARARRVAPLRLIAPPGVRVWMRELLGLAISPDHPYVEWSLSALEISEIGEGGKMAAPGGLWLEFFRVEHSPATYSILIGREGEADPVFIATSDTAWSPRLSALFGRGERLVLCDCGGADGAPGGVHLSAEEITAKILPLLAPGARLVATHFGGEPPAGEALRFARCGDLFSL